MSSNIMLYAIIIVASIIGSVGSLFLKLGSEKFNIKFNKKGLIEILKNYKLLIGISLYVLSACFFIAALKKWDLSVVYPMTSIGYIFITLLSAFVLKERINIYKIFGIASIVFGVILITMP